MRTGEKKHVTVSNYILRGIQEGRFAPGTKIPTEEQIMRALGFSRSPVRHAIAELEHRGWLARVHGSGSFVRQAADGRTLDIHTLLYSDSRGIEKGLIHGMRRAANRFRPGDLHLVLKRPGDDTREMIGILQSLPLDRKGGVVVVPVLSPDRTANRLLASTLRRLESRGMPVVQLDRFVPEYEGACVMCDHRRGAAEMTEYLIARGHRRIAVLCEHPENTSIRLRFEGVRESLGSHSLDLPESRQLDIPVREIASRGPEIARALRAGEATAVFCFECELALELHRALLACGLQVPRDISLCSFDDHCFAGVHDGFLTAVVQPLEEIGELAVDLVLRRLRDPGSKPVRIALEPAIVERASVAAL